MNIQIDDAIQAAWTLRNMARADVREYLDRRHSSFLWCVYSAPFYLKMARSYGQSYLRIRRAIEQEFKREAA